MISIFAEKPDVGTKIAAALDCITLANGTRVHFDDIDRYAKQITAQRAKDGYFKIRYQGQDAFVTWGFGHMCGLKDAKDYNEEYKNWSKIPVPFIPDKYELKVLSKVETQYSILKRIFNSSNLIICATDDDREGDLIFDYVYQHMDCRVPFKRSLFSSQTKEAFREAFDPKSLVSSEDRFPIICAGRARSIGDFVVGINLTVAMTNKYPGTGVLSIGRVQTAVLNMIVDREMEIRNFKPKDYWVIKGIFKTADGEEYIGYHEGKRFEKKDDADAIMQKLRNSGGKSIVTSVVTKEYKKGKPRLYSLDSLQIDANKTFGFTLAKTLTLAQQLYEKGFTTYPRTDSIYLTDDMGQQIQDVIDMLFMDKYYSRYKVDSRVDAKNRYYFDSSKVESHFAIVPTTKPPHGLSEDETKLYWLIATSVICMVYPEAVMSKTTIKTECNGETFLTNGTSIVDPGFFRVIGKPKESIIPSVKEGQYVTGTFTEMAKQTEPPKRYSDATLITAMINCGKTIEDEELREILSRGPDDKPLGIGRQSSRASIVATLEKREYIERKGKIIFPTSKGIQIIACFPVNDLKSAEMTARWEKRLDDISRRKDTFDSFVGDLEQSVRIWTKQVRDSETSKELAREASGTDSFIGLCPLCGKPLRKYDWGYGCTGYKDGCRFSIGKIAHKKLTDNQISKLLEGKTVHIKGLTGKKGKFDADLFMEMGGEDKGKIKFSFDFTKRK